MAGLLNALSTAVSPYVMPVVEKNLAPDFIVRFGESFESVVDMSSVISTWPLLVINPPTRVVTIFLMILRSTTNRQLKHELHTDDM